MITPSKASDDGEGLTIKVPTRSDERRYMMYLRRRTIVDYDKLSNPNVNTLIQLPIKPPTPNHVAVALNNGLRTHWIEYLFIASST